MTTSLTGDDGKIYGEPFYGESSFLMYRKDVLEAEGITMPENPTWQQVADIAAQVDGAQPGMAGICLRGQPGWGQVFAPLTTVVNTFGGTWFTEDWQAAGERAGVHEAAQFYVDLVREHGETGAPQAGFTECLNNLIQGNAAMWYDATSAAGSLEAADSPVKGKIGYAAAPVVKTEQLRLALRLGLGHPAGQQEEGRRLEVHLLGLGQGVREARRRAGRLVEGAGRQARLDLREPGVPGRGRGVRRADQGGDRERRPAQPRRAAAAGARHPVRRHPGVPRPRHAGVAGHQLGDRRADDASTHALDRGQQLADDVAERYRSRAEGELMSTSGGTAAARDPAWHRPAEETGDAASRPGDWARRAPLLPALIFMIIVTQLPFVGHAGHLVHELERLLPRRARVRRARQLPPRAHRREHAQRDHHHDRADRRRWC